jgi:hypothetical protein
MLKDRAPKCRAADDLLMVDPEDAVPEEGHSARRTDVEPYPSSGRRIGLEKMRERCTALPRIEVNRPGGYGADRLLRRVSSRYLHDRVRSAAPSNPTNIRQEGLNVADKS